MLHCIVKLRLKPPKWSIVKAHRLGQDIARAIMDRTAGVKIPSAGIPVGLINKVSAEEIKCGVESILPNTTVGVEFIEGANPYMLIAIQPNRPHHELRQYQLCQALGLRTQQ